MIETAVGSGTSLAIQSMALEQELDVARGQVRSSRDSAGTFVAVLLLILSLPPLFMLLCAQVPSGYTGVTASR